jgi:hypothetical protein
MAVSQHCISQSTPSLLIQRINSDKKMVLCHWHQSVDKEEPGNDHEEDVPEPGVNVIKLFSFVTDDEA